MSSALSPLAFSLVSLHFILAPGTLIETNGSTLGLAASAPLYTLPSLLNRTPYDRAQPASNLEKFEDANKAAASSLTLAGISGTAFLVAAYYAPAKVAYNANYIGRGASEIGARFASDRVSRGGGSQ